MELTQKIEKLSQSELKILFTIENIKDLPDNGIIGEIKNYILSGKNDFTMGEKINEIEKIALKNVVDRWMKSDLAETKFTQKIVKNIINQVMKATYEWIMKETIIVEKETGKPVENTELYLPIENKGKLPDYIIDSLETIGITYKL